MHSIYTKITGLQRSTKKILFWKQERLETRKLKLEQTNSCLDEDS